MLEAPPMASIYRDATRDGWKCQFYMPNGARHIVWLGSCSKAAAEHTRKQIESLVACKAIGAPPDAAVARWLKDISDRLAERLALFGLIESRSNSNKKLGNFLETYIKSRTDIKDRTASYLTQAKDRLLELLGDDLYLGQVTEAKADQVARDLRAMVSAATAGRELKRYRQFFTAAVRARLIDSNPFADVSVAGGQGKEKNYITPETIEAIIDKTACPEMRAVIASARYLGLRIPSEPMGLKWTDIDWELGRITIRSPKLEKHANYLRTLPIFPEARKHFDLLHDLAPDRAVEVFQRWRNSANNHYRKQFLASIKLAKLEPWPKLWHSLRASCRTDLERRFPNHVCNAWLGQSSKVAEKSYLQITDEDWKEAELCQRS